MTTNLTNIDFYFDFSSPYGYLAATQIEQFAGRFKRSVDWRPILLGAVFRVTGGRPLPQLPLKGDYAQRDMRRSARFLGVELNMPSQFPIATQVPCRAYYWTQGHNPGMARQLALALFKAYFVSNKDISSPEVTAEVAAGLGLERDQLLAGINDQAVKDRLRNEVDTAIKRGVFGSPYMVIDSEPFWGVDRFPQMERWLSQGPF